MPIVDHWAQTGDRVRPHLHADEEMLAFSATQLATGPEICTGPQPRAEQGAVAGAIDSVLFPAGPPSRPVITFLFGASARGAAGSLGLSCHAAATGAGHLYLGATAQRLLLLADPGLPPDQRLNLAWSTTRERVAGARLGWRGLAIARLTVAFTDGSSVTFSSLPLMGRRRAATFLDVLGRAR